MRKNIILFAIGTRGDVQPMIALGKGLKAAGFNVSLLASRQNQAWITQHGLTALPSSVDIPQVMSSLGGQNWVEKGHNPFLQLRIMKKLLDQFGWTLMEDAWHACQNADAILSSFTSDTYASAIGEKLGLPVISVPLQPPVLSTRNGRALLNAPLPRQVSLINYILGKAFIEPAPWQIYGKLTNRFRQEVLGLRPLTATQFTAVRRQMPVLLAYSQHVVPKPADWPPHYYPTGYFFLNEGQNWQPPESLLDFLAAGPKPVAVGFGSMIGKNPERITRLLIDAVVKSGQRAVLLSGWAGLGNGELPPSIYKIASVPHDWLFPRMAAVVHHGGAGTTAAGLRAGVPAVIVPHMADQFFWAKRLHDLGVAVRPLPRHKLTSSRLARAVQTAVSSTEMQTQARNLSQLVEAERGVETAVSQIMHLLNG